jgi:tRNA pseudouridine13 synthase
MHLQVAELPYATAKSLRTLGKIRTVPEDFRVEEVPAYPPAGHGTHLFVHFEKRGLTTREAITRLAKALSVNVRDAGVAGQKDKHAVTIQWASFAGATEEAALALALPDIRVLRAALHPHKLRTGHVRANRFVLVLRETDAAELARELMSELARVGVPNYFGEQRFGHADRNVARGLAMLNGSVAAPRDRFERKLLMSSVQSALFNRWLAARIEDGHYERPIAGDLLRKEDTGGLFINQDEVDAAARMASWQVSPTGPMFGASMRSAEGDAALREQAIFAQSSLTDAMLAAHANAGEGTRRVARVRPTDWEVASEPGCLRLSFELPAGAYATTLMRELMKSDCAP